MSDTSPSLLSADEPTLKAATLPTPPPQPGEHSMYPHSQGPGPHCSLLDTDLSRHIHTHPAVDPVPTVATPMLQPRRILHKAAASSSASTGIRSDDMTMAPATDTTSNHGFYEDFEFGTIPPDGTTTTRSAGGRTMPAPTDGTATTRLAGGQTAPTPTNCTTMTRSVGEHTAPDEVVEYYPEFVITLIAGRNVTRPARPTMLELFAAAIKQLPNLEEPVNSFLW